MDRYDESKHVDTMRQDDDVRPLDRDVVVSRGAEVEGEAVVVVRDAEVRHESTMAHDADVSRDSEMPRESDMPKRQGDILGLGGSVVPKSADDPSTEYDAESTAHRRTRSLDMDEPAGGSDMTRSKGATGIDMGSGGSGTDLE